MFCNLSEASRGVCTVLPFDMAPVVPNGSLNCEFSYSTRICLPLIKVLQKKTAEGTHLCIPLEP